MSFETVIQRFEQSNCNFSNFCGFTEQWMRQNRDPGFELDRPDLGRVWRLGYEVLSSIWNSTKSLPTEVRSNQWARNRLHLLFLDDRDKRSFLIFSRENIGSKNPTDYSIDAILDELVHDLTSQRSLKSSTMRKAPFPLFNGFIERMLSDEARDFDQAVLESCECEDGLFIGDFYRLARVDHQSDPAKRAVSLKATESSPWLSLSINLVSTDPLEQKRRVLDELDNLRSHKLPEYGDKPIREYSWLIRRGNERYLKMLGLKTDDVRVEYYDLNRIFLPGGSVPEGLSDLNKYNYVLHLSLLGLTLSRGQLRRFITTGLLPDVGLITIPSHIFFNRN